MDKADATLALTNLKKGDVVEWWFSGYMAVGLIWSLWNSQSRFFQSNAVWANRTGHSWILLVSLLLGMLLWPIGVFFTVAYWPRRKQKDR